MVAMAFLFAFALIDWYPGAVLALMMAGMGIAGFATMQSTLVMVAAGPEMRGRALGMMSMAIGALPFGLIGVGLIAQEIGASGAVMISAGTGLAGIALWMLRHPEVHRLR